MTMSTLVRLSESKLTRQEYLRRQDDILLAAKRANDYKLMERRMEQEMREKEREKRRAEQEKRRAEQEKHRAEQAESALEEKDVIIAELKARFGIK